MVSTKMVDNQYTDFDDFLNDIDFVIVMVSHTHILHNEHKLEGKIILDTQKVLKNSIVNYL